jgi:hypothetical protein
MTTNPTENGLGKHETIARTAVEAYTFKLVEPSRPPSKGGNTRAQHRHAIKVRGVWYSWFALGAQKWVFVNDEVSFSWEWDRTQQYRNLVPESLQTWDKAGNLVNRGLRGTKPKLRTALTRLPGRRSEWND